MCLVNRLQSDLSTISGHAVAAESRALDSYSVSASNTGQLRILLANVRGLRQAAGELSKLANEFKQHLIGMWRLICRAIHSVDCCHVVIGALIGWTAGAKHGGGLLWASLTHLLVDKVPLKQYNVVSVSEMLGIDRDTK